MSQDPNAYNPPYPPQQPGMYAGYPPQQPAAFGGYPQQQPAGYGQNQMPFQPPPVVPRPEYPKGLFSFHSLNPWQNSIIELKESGYRGVPQDSKGMNNDLIWREYSLMLISNSIEEIVVDINRERSDAWNYWWEYWSISNEIDFSKYEWNDSSDFAAHFCMRFFKFVVQLEQIQLLTMTVRMNIVYSLVSSKRERD